jgi:hypothetical protein
MTTRVVLNALLGMVKVFLERKIASATPAKRRRRSICLLANITRIVVEEKIATARRNITLLDRKFFPGGAHMLNEPEIDAVFCFHIMELKSP